MHKIVEMLEKLLGLNNNWYNPTLITGLISLLILYILDLVDKFLQDYGVFIVIIFVIFAFIFHNILILSYKIIELALKKGK